MSSKKVSQEPAAQSLTGDELVRVVQAGQSKRTTTQAIAALSAVAKAGDTMTGALNWATTQTIASAATTDIGAATSNVVIISGTTPITGLGTIAAGAERCVTFSGALTLTHNATSLILPGAASITTAAGDVAYFVSLGSGNWRCTGYQKANGQAVTGIEATIPTGPINIYVSTTGNDLNDGKTLGTAFRTVTRAVIESEKIVNSYYKTIINIDAGDYSAEGSLPLCVYPSASRDGEYALDLKSISNVSTDVILPTVSISSGAVKLTSVTVKGSAGFGLAASNYGGIYAKNLITLNTQLPLYAYNHGWLLIQNLHVKDSTEFYAVCCAQMLGSIEIGGTMQNTNSTGPRYLANGLSIINTYGQGENYLPGTTAGTVSNGGVYA